MAQFDDAKAGDRVWSSGWGWGNICKISPDSTYPLIVQFSRSRFTFTIEGRISVEHINPTLFWDEVKIVPPERPKETITVLKQCLTCGHHEEVDLKKEKCEACERINDYARTPDCNGQIFWLLGQHHTCEKKDA